MDAMMHEAATLDSALAIEWGVASRPLAGQIISGDVSAVVRRANGVVVAAADGLGHGEEAASAAEIAARTLKLHAEESLTDIIVRCHEALRRTRGVAISIASFDVLRNTMTWTGIGNVEGTLFRAASNGLPPREALLLRGGVVGYSLPQPRTATVAVAPGDILIFATDGVATGFRHESMQGGSVQDLVTDILLRYGREIDDALVLAARYVGVS
jgi:negative regulator of sigma-B (phosphoserine phosphatase)